MSDLGPTDYKSQLGEVLEALRLRVGLERSDAAAALQCSEAKIKSFEKGRTAVAPLDLTALLDRYGVVGEERVDIEHLGTAARQRRPRTPWGSAIPTRLHNFFKIEQTATDIRIYEPELVHGLAQTEDYARAAISTNRAYSAQHVDRLVQARMARQQRLDGPNPPRLVVVMSEAAIRIGVGEPSVMRAQLVHLVALGKRPSVEIRIVPFEVGLFAARGFPFALITRPRGKKVAFVEALSDALYFDDPGRLEIYEAAWDELVNHAALSSEDSLTLLDTVALQL